MISLPSGLKDNSDAQMPKLWINGTFKMRLHNSYTEYGYILKLKFLDARKKNQESINLQTMRL